MQGLALEWERQVPLLKRMEIVSIYFGGGTPSLLGAERLATIVSWIAPDSSVEITLEVNPEQVTRSLIEAYRAAGVNRVSIGVQTFDEKLLQYLSRQHSGVKAIEAVNLTAEAGIHNISIDLMYDIPHQTLSQWKQTLQQATLLPITHLSLYNLTIEPNTVFFKYADRLKPFLPEPEISLQMYEMALEVLPGASLFPYEISAFAKDNYYSRHNTGYWLGRPFLGFGPSAFSYWKGKRFRNVSNLIHYTQALKEGKSPIDFSEELSENARRRELLAIGLRLKAGVSLDTFERQQGTLEDETKKVLYTLEQDGFVSCDQNRGLTLTKKGILFYDTVATELI